VSGYGPRVSEADTTHDALFVVVVVVVAVVVVDGLVGDEDPHAASAAAPTLAPSATSTSRRASFFDSFADMKLQPSKRVATQVCAISS